MDMLFTRLFEIFSIEYMFSVIMASYFTIKVVDAFNRDKTVPSWLKRMITFVNGAILFGVFKIFTNVDLQNLIASFFAAVYVYDAAIKVIIEKFNIGYKK